jgi:hypothetical protein
VGASFQARLEHNHALLLVLLNLLVSVCNLTHPFFLSSWDQVKAKKEGYDNVLYLDAVEAKYLEEVGTSNVFVVKGKTIYTPGVSLTHVNLKTKTKTKPPNV